MIGTKPQLILYGSDSALLEVLKLHSVDLRYISYEAGYGPHVTAKAHLDAFWVTLMGGVELFNATPPFPLHEARIMRTPAAQLEKGFPRYGIVGVAVAENDPKSPEYSLRVVVSALLNAVNDFNTRNEDQILRVGLLPDDLGLRALKPEAVFRIVQEVYETT